MSSEFPPMSACQTVTSATLDAARNAYIELLRLYDRAVRRGDEATLDALLPEIQLRQAFWMQCSTVWWRHLHRAMPQTHGEEGGDQEDDIAPLTPADHAGGSP